MSKTVNRAIGFHHVGVVVPNLDRAIEFYTALFGFELHSEGSWSADNVGFNQVVGLRESAARFCMLRGANGYIEFFDYMSPAGMPSGVRQANEYGIRHLCFAMDNVNAALDRCVELGGSRINEPYTVPGGGTAAYCRDPFGNLLEFVSPGGRFPEPFLP